MITFKCHNKECDYFPCYLRCDQAASENEFGDGGIEKPLSCPYDMETAKWKILPYTPILQNTIDLPCRLYELQGYSDLSHCTKAIFLDGYRLSTGAMLELSYCQKHNIPIIEESELEEAINRGLGYAEL